MGPYSINGAPRARTPAEPHGLQPCCFRAGQLVCPARPRGPVVWWVSGGLGARRGARAVFAEYRHAHAAPLRRATPIAGQSGLRHRDGLVRAGAAHNGQVGDGACAHSRRMRVLQGMHACSNPSSVASRAPAACPCMPLIQVRGPLGDCRPRCRHPIRRRLIHRRPRRRRPSHRCGAAAGATLAAAALVAARARPARARRLRRRRAAAAGSTAA